MSTTWLTVTLLIGSTLAPMTYGSADPSPFAVCSGQPDGTVCDDGNPCTAGESCRAGTCVPPATLSAGSPILVGTGPRSVATGDWTGDGILDLAVANRTSNDVTILKGNGVGGFVAVGVPVPVDNGPIAIAGGDWNGNGVRDLAVANSSSNTVSILLGDGAGGFTAAGSGVSVGSVPVSVAAGDWDADGKADLAVANQSSSSVTILLGDGSGGFAPAPGSPIAVGTFPVSVVASDLNGDGTPDLVVANQTSNSVTILLGVGNGQFADAPGSPVPVAGGPFSIAALDSRGSGILDLAVVSISGNTVTILLGNGTGGFSAGSPVAVGTGPRSVAARDLNRDGRLDLAVANFGTNDVTILLGNGLGGFAAIGTVAVGTGPSSIVGGDWDGNGKQDLAVANTSTNNVMVVLNTTTHLTNGLTCDDLNACTTTDVCQSGVCGGTPATNGTTCSDGNACTLSESCRAGTCVPFASFGQPAGSPVTAGAGPRPIVTGYFNADSIVDLAVANRAGNSVTIMLGSGSGGFTTSTLAFGAGPIAIAVGDWDGNGTSDLALANSNTGANSVTILLGNGAGGFSQATGSPVAVSTVPVSVATGDFNGDGKADLAVANQNSNNVTILLGTGAGGFTPAGLPVSVGTTPVAVSVGDWNGDAKLDLAVADFGQAAPNVTILLGTGAGGFTAGSTVSAGTGPFAIAVGDLNGDGRPDLAVANNGSSNLTILLSSGAGTFSPGPGSPITVGTQPRSVVARDLNRDGRLDLAVANFGTDNLTVLLGNGAGGFGAIGTVAAGDGPSSVAGGDLNGDGNQDLALANTNSNDATILLNSPSVAVDGTVCNDFNPCTQTDACLAGTCTGGNAVVCTPSDTCQLSRCSVATGICSNLALPNGTSCSDGTACTTGDTCGAGTCQGTALTCSDGNACNGVETCNPASGCVAGTPVNCNDSLFCTIDTCNASTGACSHGSNPCADFNACSLDVCDEGSDSCLHNDPSMQVCNTSSIAIPVLGAATPYPSPITIAGEPPNSSVCSVSLLRVAHTFPNDLDILLERTSGPNALILSDVGGGADVVDIDLVLNDLAALAMPDGPTLISGTFRPTNFGATDAFPAPAPAVGGPSALSTFDGTDPNGVWNLWVADDANTDSGSIAGGWCMNLLKRACSAGPITINDSTTPPTVATPYPSTINVSGASGPFTLVSVELHGVDHTFPSDIDILLAAPHVANGAILMSDVGGGADVTGVDLTLTDGAPPLPNSGPLVSGVFSPTNISGSDAWPAPAPVASGSSALSQFNGSDPNGDWKLFVVDDSHVDQGSMTGWCITYRTTCSSSAECNDGNVCNGLEGCNTATGCEAGTPLHCDDGNACNGVETCNPVSGCQAGTPVPAPPEVLGLTLGPLKSALAWSPASNATTYDVLRGALTGLPVGPGGGDENCLGSVSGTTTTDTSVPSTGAGFWYLIRGRNACNPPGDYGRMGVLGAPGAARVSSTCP